MEGVQAPDLTSRRGILNPDAAERHFRLTRYAPSDDLAHLIDRHWVVEWDLREPYTQEIVTHPSVNLALVPGRGARSTASSPGASGRS